MRMVMRYEDGRRVEAILLAAGRDQMRVIVRTQRDTTDLNRVGDHWYNENGVQVEVEAMMPVPGDMVAQNCAEIYPMVMSAGRMPLHF